MNLPIVFTKQTKNFDMYSIADPTKRINGSIYVPKGTDVQEIVLERVKVESK